VAAARLLVTVGAVTGLVEELAPAKVRLSSGRCVVASTSTL